MSNRAAVATNVASGTTDVQAVAAAVGLRITGYAAQEGAAGTATAVLRHGTSAAGTPIAYISLASGGMTTQYLGDRGVGCSSGLFLERITGTMTVTVYTVEN